MIDYFHYHVWAIQASGYGPHSKLQLKHIFSAKRNILQSLGGGGY